MSMPQVMSRVARAGLATNALARAASKAAHHAKPSFGFAASRSVARPTRAMASSAATAEKVAEAPKPIYLKDYTAPDYRFAKVVLDFELGEEVTVVGNTISVEPTFAAGGDPRPLFLNGDPTVELAGVEVNGTALDASAYVLTKKGLTITAPPAAPFELKITTKIKPQENTELEGLYKSSGNFCTQCEAEGFRRITFYQDRPDVMSEFTTRITADKAKYPVLLSNGNLVDSGDLDGGKHFTVWEDPFPKPAYLFALVAGDLGMIEDKFTTKSGREVALRIYVEEHNLDKADWAMVSLIKSMKWDEDVFGLEYDLDLFNIVAVDDFNMGAMENKSLNIFNSRLVLATPQTATDMDYSAIEGVVAHEYFHNWTGNRVTCRDWFQLSLKEGLTVYRDQEFSADMNSRGVKRIGDVARLRMAQFPQDAGPMAHPIRPESYIKMDNFYTVTVYEKGAEVVRMYETLLGKDGFRKGMDLYFERHDGQAVTCDDFLAAMADANGADLDSLQALVLPGWHAQARRDHRVRRGGQDVHHDLHAVHADDPGSERQEAGAHAHRGRPPRERRERHGAHPRGRSRGSRRDHQGSQALRGVSNFRVHRRRGKAGAVDPPQLQRARQAQHRPHPGGSHLPHGQRLGPVQPLGSRPDPHPRAPPRPRGKGG